MLLGCDTTSRIHGIGKPVALRKRKTAYFRVQAAVFSNTAAVKEDITAAGERTLVCLYNGRSDESLHFLHYTRFCLKFATGNTCVQPESLPPTSAAARFHSLRVYHQVQQWKGTNLQPQEWGWELRSGKHLPVRTKLPPAPPFLLEVIRCSWKTDCHKNGLDGSAACGACKGVSCSNTPVVVLAVEDDDNTV